MKYFPSVTGRFYARLRPKKLLFYPSMKSHTKVINIHIDSGELTATEIIVPTSSNQRLGVRSAALVIIVVCCLNH